MKGSDNIKDDEHIGRPSSSRTPDVIQKVSSFVEENRCASLRLIKDALNINKETIRTIIHEDLGKTKVCSKFVTHSLKNEQKSRRIEYCREIILVSLRNRLGIKKTSKLVFIYKILNKEE